MSSLYYSIHALNRLTEMKVSKEECESAFLYPISTSWSNQHRSRIYRGRRVSVCVMDADHGTNVDVPEGMSLVKTVIWTDDDMFPILSPNRKKTQ